MICLLNLSYSLPYTVLDLNGQCDEQSRHARSRRQSLQAGQLQWLDVLEIPSRSWRLGDS